ncbi:MAG: hypothetical protein ACYC7A_21100 [Thermoanaerobaculia bacterium]
MRKQHVLFMVGILLIATGAFAQQPAPGGQQPMQMPSGEMKPMNCDAMMQKMQSSSKVMDDRLQALVDEMNKAKGSSKVDRTAAVINELVSQRKQMRQQMMAMIPQMIEHTTQHMQSGMMHGMSKSMSACPMMKGSAPAERPAATEQKKR